MEFREGLNALRSGWWIVIAGLAVGALGALGISLAQPREYTSHLQFFVSTTDSGSTADVFQGSQFSQNRVASYARLLNGQELAQRVVDSLRVIHAVSSTGLRQRARTKAARF